MIGTTWQAVDEHSEVQASLLRGFLRNSQDGIVLIDHQGCIQEWNPAQERLSGLLRAEVLGEPLSDVVFRLIPPEIRSVNRYVQSKTMIDAYLRGERADWMSRLFEHDILRSDGGRRVIQISYFPLRTTAGPAAGSIARDVTALRQAEQSAQRTLAMKEQFVAGVSHSLRKPLEALSGMLELLRRGTPADPSDQHELMERALAEIAQLRALVNELIETVDFESGSVQLNMEQVDLERVIDQAMQALRELAGQRQVKLAYAPSHPPQAVRGNAGRLKQVLINLLENAIHVSASGSPVLVTSHAENHQLIVQVIDQGPGIPAEQEAMIFEKQLPRSNSPATPGGSGLGLYLCKHIIQAHGGQLGVRSQLGVGSTFYFSLPSG